MFLDDPNNHGWYMDIGATTHLHAESGILKTFSKHMACYFVVVGGRCKIYVSNMGDNDISFSNRYRPLSLKNILISPI